MRRTAFGQDTTAGGRSNPGSPPDEEWGVDPAAVGYGWSCPIVQPWRKLDGSGGMVVMAGSVSSTQDGHRLLLEALRRMLAPLPMAAVALDADGLLLHANEGARRLWGWSEGAPAFLSRFDEICPLQTTAGERWPFVRTPAGQLLSGASLALPQQGLVPGLGAAGVPVMASAALLPDGQGAIAYFQDLSGAHDLRLAEARTRFLVEAGRVLVSSLDLMTTLSNLARLAAPRYADWCVIGLADENGELLPAEMVCVDSSQLAYVTPMSGAPVPPDTLLARAFRSGRTQLEGESRVAIPLKLRNRCLGAVAFGSGVSRRRYTPEAIELALEVAARAAMAVEHAQLYWESEQARARAEQQRRRLEVMSETSRLLTEAGFEFETAYRGIVHHICETMGDACVLTVADEPGEQQRPVAFDHRDPVRRQKLAEAIAGGPPGAALGLAGPVYATGKALRVVGLPEEMLDGPMASRPLVAEYVRAFGLESLLVVPLRLGDRLMGTLGVGRDAGGEPYTAEDESLLQDLADRAALVFEKSRLYRQSQQALAHREAFLSIASHELRTPLSSMRLNVQSYLRKLRKDHAVRGPEVIEKLQAVDLQISRLGKLIDELLDVSRITAGRLALEPERMDLTGLVQEIVDRFEGTAEEAGCTVLWQQGQPIIGYWDRSRIDQIVTNLLTNALKYGRGKPVIVKSGVRNGAAFVSVRDHGIGIAPENQQRIFERFERAVSSRNYSGFGLGLWISRQLAVAHRGEIRVSSEPGQGATFVLELPVDGPAADSSSV